ncbi:aldo/keto reductase [Lentilactobacillus senioris]|uniref:aldo/keto reductase n=1 Tax=Lentilactobacillus senioris TaxID=931534 RepID=UPI002281F03C|nr:aldo/keto reductase [Lentilactobacillus senioris]MCY9806358.1 aldo/keto reductase [Lentilactobacillus senioris]
MEADNLLTLADENKMPQVGFGTYLINKQDEMDTAVQTAFEAGYRLFDTAQMYRNEQVLAAALNHNGIARQDVFITDKVANENQGYELTVASVDFSLEQLGTDYIDLMLVHWPINTKFFDTWRALEDVKKAGKVKSIGVSNYNRAMLELLKTQATEMPVVNQIENHPYLTSQGLVDYDQAEEIITQAWSPLGRGAVLDNPMIQKMADHHNRSVAQIILRWQVQRGLSMISKSVNPARIKENLQIFDFELSADEMSMLDILNRNERTGNDPEEVYELGHQYR